jgi:hypothetical protein
MRGMSSMSSWESGPNPKLQTPVEFGEESNGESSDSEEDDCSPPFKLYSPACFLADLHPLCTR